MGSPPDSQWVSTQQNPLWLWNAGRGLWAHQDWDSSERWRPDGNILRGIHRTKWPSVLYRQRGIFAKQFFPAAPQVRGSETGWSGLWAAKHWKVKHLCQGLLLRGTEATEQYVWKCWANLPGISHLSNKLLAVESLSHDLFFGGIQSEMAPASNKPSFRHQGKTETTKR